MPAPSDYRRQAVAVLTQALAVAEGDLRPDAVVGLELRTDHLVDPADIGAFISREVTCAVGGLSQLVLVLLDYLESYASADQLDRASWLRRAAAEAERRESERLRDTPKP